MPNDESERITGSNEITQIAHQVGEDRRKLRQLQQQQQKERSQPILSRLEGNPQLQ